MRIALFVTCIGDAIFPEAAQATVEVLERLGHEVGFPAEQTCCGQMHLNSGYRNEADRLGARFREVFAGFDTVVAPSSSCVGHVRGIDLVELPDARECCGFGGTFAVKNAETSAAILADKVRSVLDTGAEVCTALDSSCLLHIGGALSRMRAGVRTMHLAEVLASTA